MFERVSNSIDQWRRFLTHDVWRIGKPDEEAPDDFFIKQIRVAILLVQNLVRDALMVRAAALTFATILGIVPFLVILLVGMQRFNVQELIEQPLRALAERVTHEQIAIDVDTAASTRALLRRILLPNAREPQTASETPAESLDVITELFAAAQRTVHPEEKSGAVTLAFILFLLSTVFGLMRNIEHSFNAIWGVKEARGWIRSTRNYLLIILVLPIFAITAFTLAAILSSETLVASLGPLAVTLRLFQYLIPFFALTLLYYVVPNTDVRFRYAVLGGLVAGVLWSLSSVLYLQLLKSSGNYASLYATFAQIPLLLMWLYLSWVIVLFGAELSFAYQNVKTFAMERWAKGASYAYREALGIRAMIDVCSRFDAGMPGLEVAAAAEEWHVPTRLLNETLDQLEEAGLVRPCATTPPTYVPGRTIAHISLGDIVNALHESGRDPSELRQDPPLRDVLQLLETIRGPQHEASLCDLVRQWRERQAPALMVLPATDLVPATGKSDKRG